MCDDTVTVVLDPGELAWLDRHAAATGQDLGQVLGHAVGALRAQLAAPPDAPCPGACAACGRALAACQWCGRCDVLAGPGGQRLPVVIRPGWDGPWHDPCHDRETALRGWGQDPGGVSP